MTLHLSEQQYAALMPGLSPFEAAFQRLTALPDGSGLVLRGEDRFSSTVFQKMRELRQSGRYRGVFFKVPNEAKRGWMVYVLLRWIGMIPGTTDWVLIWRNAAGGLDALLVELKTSSGRLKPIQQDFKLWCDTDGIPHLEASSWDVILDVLEQMGAIRSPEISTRSLNHV